MNPNDLADYLHRILWTLFVTDPAFFKAKAIAAGLTHEESVGHFVGDCIVHYAGQHHPWKSARKSRIAQGDGKSDVIQWRPHQNTNWLNSNGNSRN